MKMGKYDHLPRLIDECDSDLELSDKYCTVKNGKKYFYRTRKDADGKTTILLHREIASRILGRKLERRELVDHWDGNGLNNRRSNLRIVTRQQNQENRVGLDARNKSGYRGVSFHKSCGKWMASVKTNGKSKNLGCYQDLIFAAALASTWRATHMTHSAD